MVHSFQHFLSVINKYSCSKLSYKSNIFGRRKIGLNDKTTPNLYIPFQKKKDFQFLKQSEKLNIKQN